MKNVNKKFSVKTFIVLHLILLLYSIIAIFSKKASAYKFLSFKFILFYGLMLFCLGVYAILWQQILKKFPLTFAFSNKAVVIIWGMIWGKVFFGEEITVNMIVGAIIIIVGIIIVASDEGKDD